MRKSLTILTALVFAAFVATAFADSGQMIVYKRKEPKPKPSTGSRLDPIVDLDAQGDVNDEEPTPVPFDEDFLDELAEDDEIGDFWQEGRSFREPLQQALIAWNGEEEILILQTMQESLLPKDGAVLSVVPLPGRPIDVSRGDPKAFERAWNELERQMADAGRERALTETLSRRDIGTHSIVAIRVDSTSDLYGELDAYLEKTYGTGTSVYLGAKQRAVLRYYVEKCGFRYFAFDLQRSRPNGMREKDAIAYRFKTSRVFYPLVISRLGGTGRTDVALIVVTPGSFKSEAFTLKNFRQVSPTCDVDLATLRTFDRSVAELMATRRGPYKFRAWLIFGEMDEFAADLFVK